jgi:hypothetical protein
MSISEKSIDEMNSGAGTKDDWEKIRYDLIPPDALESLAMLYTIGSKKYNDRNWENGMKWSRVHGALMRHLQAWFMGEDIDPETGLPHLTAVVWNSMALLSYQLRNSGTDDRPLDYLRVKTTDEARYMCELPMKDFTVGKNKHVAGSIAKGSTIND